MKTKHTTKDKHLVVDKNWIKEKIAENGLVMIESTFTILKNGFFAFTPEGYIVKVTANSIYKNQSNPIFSNLNPYTIYNINRFLYLNNIETILLSKEYHRNRVPLEWMCSCGKEFKVSWSAFLQGQRICRCCARRKWFLIPVDKLKADFKNRGYRLLTETPKTKKEKVEYECLKHLDKGVQEISITKFYDRHQGCKYCGLEINAMHRAVDEKECMKLTQSKGLNFIKSYLEDGRTKIDFTCDKHKDKGVQTFSITQMRKTRSGCKYCNMATYTNEERINSLLESWGLLFERQRSFKECRDKNAMPFDFYIPDFNLLIEYQGEQHYCVIPRGSMTEQEAIDNLELIQKHDEIKREYCSENNINYIEIPYWESEDIENFLFDKFIEIGIFEEVKQSA